MTDIGALVKRVEAATGPDAFLDAHIRAALDMPATLPVTTECPNYTASIDAALSLVERVLPGYGLELYWGTVGAAACLASDATYSQHWSGSRCPTPALAILGALLTALKSKQAQDAEGGA